MSETPRYPLWLALCSILACLVLLSGFILAVIYHGKNAAFVLPLGMLLSWVTARALLRFDRKRHHTQIATAPRGSPR